MAESESDIRITTSILYLALTGELWGVYCDDFGEIWPRYNDTALYFVTSCHKISWSSYDTYCRDAIIRKLGPESI